MKRRPPLWHPIYGDLGKNPMGDFWMRLLGYGLLGGFLGIIAACAVPTFSVLTDIL